MDARGCFLNSKARETDALHGRNSICRGPVACVWESDGTIAVRDVVRRM